MFMYICYVGCVYLSFCSKKCVQTYMYVLKYINKHKVCFITDIKSKLPQLKLYWLWAEVLGAKVNCNCPYVWMTVFYFKLIAL